jgi:hypothetical protein
MEMGSRRSESEVTLPTVTQIFLEPELYIFVAASIVMIPALLIMVSSILFLRKELWFKRVLDTGYYIFIGCVIAAYADMFRLSLMLLVDRFLV